MRFTETYQQVPEGFIGFVDELPGANAQGKTLEETRRNLHEAIALILDVTDAERALQTPADECIPWPQLKADLKL